MSNRPASPRGSSSDGVVLAEFQEVAVRRSILSIGGCVYQGVDDAGGPGQDGRDDVEPRIRDAVVGDIHYHQRQEAREEAEEYRQH